MIPHSRTRHTRLCFSEKKRKPADSKGSKQGKTLELLPNFPFRKGRISVDSMLPSKDVMQESKGSTFSVKQGMEDFLSKHKPYFEMAFPSFGQLVTLYFLKPEHRKAKGGKPLMLSSSFSTTCLFTINDNFATLSGISCLHSVTRFDCEDAATMYDSISYFVKTEGDISERGAKAAAHLQVQEERRASTKSANELGDEWCKLLRKRYSNSIPVFLAQVTVSSQFLQMRKEFIDNSVIQDIIVSQKNGANHYEHPLIDAEFFLQPTPSLDVILYTMTALQIEDYEVFLKSSNDSTEFEYSEKSSSFASSLSLLTSASQKSWSFLTIDLNKVPTPTTSQQAFIIGYQNIELRKPEQEVYRKSFFAKIDKFLDSEFMNEGLSIGFCEIKSSSKEILTFNANTADGSSGSPLIDMNLRIIGINFGCYYDYQEDQVERDKRKKANKKSKKERKSKSVDKMITTGKSKSDKNIKPTEKKQNLVKDQNNLLYYDREISEPGGEEHKSSFKNRNLAISISHPTILKWLKARYEEEIERAKKDRKEKKIFKDKSKELIPVKLNKRV